MLSFILLFTHYKTEISVESISRIFQFCPFFCRLCMVVYFYNNLNLIVFLVIIIKKQQRVLDLVIVLLKELRK